MSHMTTRKYDGNQYEPLPAYGWRCGTYSLTPELARHAKHPEFLAGVRQGRAQRQQTGMPAAYGMILSLPHLRAMRKEIQEAFNDAAQAQKILDSRYRAAARGMGEISCIGRDVGERRLSDADRHAEDVTDLWATHRRLSDAYEAERSRLLAKRGM